MLIVSPRPSLMTQAGSGTLPAPFAATADGADDATVDELAAVAAVLADVLDPPAARLPFVLAAAGAAAGTAMNFGRAGWLTRALLAAAPPFDCGGALGRVCKTAALLLGALALAFALALVALLLLGACLAAVSWPDTTAAARRSGRAAGRTRPEGGRRASTRGAADGLVDTGVGAGGTTGGALTRTGFSSVAAGLGVTAAAGSTTDMARSSRLAWLRRAQSGVAAAAAPSGCDAGQRAAMQPPRGGGTSAECARHCGTARPRSKALASPRAGNAMAAKSRTAGWLLAV